MRAPNPMLKRIPGPGGSQESPDPWSRRVVIWAWLLAYVPGVIAAGLSETIGGKMFFTIIGGAPVLLFMALGLTGALTLKCARAFAVLWGLVALAATARAVAEFFA